MSETVKVERAASDNGEKQFYELPPLTPAGIIEIQDRLYEANRIQMIDDLDLADAPPEVRARELLQLTKDKDLVDGLSSHCFTVRGAVEIVEASLERAKSTGMTHVPKFDDLGLDPTDSLIVTALALIGIEWKRKTTEVAASSDPIARRSHATGISNPL